LYARGGLAIFQQYALNIQFITDCNHCRSREADWTHIFDLSL
jgi:hypothetical protein